MLTSGCPLLVIILLLSVSCRKDPATNPEQAELIPDTIHPMCYLPVYPGSWWQYVRPSGDTVMHTTTPTYIPHQFDTCDWGNWVATPLRYVPEWKGIPVYGYKQMKNIFGSTSCGGGYHLYPIKALDTIPGAAWGHSTSSPSGGGGYASYLVNTTDTTIVVNGTTYNNVIQVLQGGGSYMSGFMGYWTAYYYACDVGLVLEQQIQPDTVDSYVLIDHFINQ